MCTMSCKNSQPSTQHGGPLLMWVHIGHTHNHANHVLTVCVLCMYPDTDGMYVTNLCLLLFTWVRHPIQYYVHVLMCINTEYNHFIVRCGATFYGECTEFVECRHGWALMAKQILIRLTPIIDCTKHRFDRWSAEEKNHKANTIGIKIVWHRWSLLFRTMWSWDCDVVLVRRTTDLGKPWGVGKLEWGGDGEGMGRGRSVYEQPGTRVDGIAPHKMRDSK